MKNFYYRLTLLFMALTLTTPLFAQVINISTGVTNTGASIGIGNVDPNWVIAAGPTGPNCVMEPSYPGYWESTPVSGTNAGWINSNGTHVAPAGIYTFERSIPISACTDGLYTSFSIAYDDFLVSLELVPPAGSPILLAGSSGTSSQYFLGPVITHTEINPMAGTWKIRATTNFVDHIGGFMLSGNAILFVNNPVCGCENLTVGFNPSVQGCQGTFNAVVNNPSSMGFMYEWFVDNVSVSMNNNLNYTFPGNGTYNVCLKVTGIMPDGKLCVRGTCQTVTVTGCIPPCACDWLNADFSEKMDGCHGVFDAAGNQSCFSNVVHSWYINNVFVANGPSATLNFPGSGVYTVCHKVTAQMPDGQFCERQICEDVIIGDCQIECRCEDLFPGFTLDVQNCTGEMTATALIPPCITDIHYEWKVNGLIIGNGSPYFHQFPGPGNYQICIRVIYTLPDGEPCEKEFCEMYRIKECDNPDGLKSLIFEETTDQDITLYPNPAGAELNIGIDMKDAETVIILFKTLDGKEVLNQTTNLEAGQQHLTIGIPANIADQMIFVEITKGGEKIIRKVNVLKH